MKFSRVPYDLVPWECLDSYEDRTFSQRKEWLDFVCETQGGEPVIARLEDGGYTLGYFTGVLIKRMGFTILGSPFPGWTTPYMGFNLSPEVSRTAAVSALIPFAFRDLNCHHLEIADPALASHDMTKLGFQMRMGQTFRSDLTVSEDELFSRMDSACRRCIRKASKSNVTVEEADSEGFAHEYYQQLIDVFAKQNLRPTYRRDRVEALIKHYHSTGNLLLLRARSPDGQCIATGIYPGFNKTSFFWGNASFREQQHLRPNEALHWYAMKYWKTRGIQSHFWGNGGDYKRKYGGEEVPFMEFRLSRGAATAIARDTAKALYFYGRNVRKQVLALTRSFLTT
ncbi:GNAT family protein [Microvirga sp. CF3016]|uniref:GNAT family protein n=1 Tax=Microvirga sp. CF3016 TaxID=3110181 RepID=UPI002E76E813|nr:GNAT family protein [Microvirga sp. CF3016]MEE1612170.1 GNAT family protein [Microvirga sp. CF3016]